MHVINQLQFHGIEELEEEEQDRHLDTNISAVDSVVEIGNTIKFNGNVVILPDENELSSTAAEHIINEIQTGEIKPKNIGEELKETDECCCLTKTGIFLSVLGILVGIVVIITLYFSQETECGDIVSREDWRAAPPQWPLLRYEKAPILVLVYQTEKDECQTCKDCINQVKGLQSFQQKPRRIRAPVRPAPAPDIQYNFLVGGDGRIYEGRGFSFQGGASKTFRNQTLILAFMGLFITKQPLAKQLDNAEKFLENAAVQSHLDPDFKVAGAMQVGFTDSPGCALLENLQLWKRWTEEPLKVLNSTKTRNETYADLCKEQPPTY